MTHVDGQALDILYKRTSAKWTGSPGDILPMPVAEMDFEIDPAIKARLHALVDASDTGYAGNNLELRMNLAGFAKKAWNWELDPEQISTCGDVGVGMVEVGRAVTKPGEKVMINTPVYLNMRNWADRLNLEVVDAQMHKDGMHYTLDFDAIEAGYKSGVKAHFLCNPHNPTGTVFTKEELSRLADLAKRYGVIVLSDEIHAPITYEKGAFVPFLSVSETAREVGICVTSASKAWNLAGLKCAQIITQHEKTKAIIDAMPMGVRFGASHFGVHAGAVAFTCTDWLEGALKTLDRNRKLLASLLAEKLPQVHYRVPDCSYLAWLDVTELGLGEDPAKTIFDQGKLYVNSGILFGPQSANFVRMNFGTSAEIITEGVNRLVKAAQK
ncbi:MAG: aminotransferase class I/II-fold pyridoxal phosphate-dependent enzyme [Actinomycetes bacterium]